MANVPQTYAQMLDAKRRPGPTPADLTNVRFGHLVALAFAGGRSGSRYWFCICDCGNFTTVDSHSLRRGSTISCRCIERARLGVQVRKHGMCDTPEYRAWVHAKDRCYNASDRKYRHYGARGIRMCERWLNSFENFLADMGPKPAGLTLDRIDNNGDYEPSNCRWATYSQQNFNRRSRQEIANG